MDEGLATAMSTLDSIDDARTFFTEMWEYCVAAPWDVKILTGLVFLMLLYFLWWLIFGTNGGSDAEDVSSAGSESGSEGGSEEEEDEDDRKLRKELKAMGDEMKTVKEALAKAEAKTGNQDASYWLQPPDANTQVGVSALLSRLEKQEKILEQDKDSQKGRRGSSVPPESTTDPDGVAPAGSNHLLKELEASNVNVRERIMTKVRNYKPKVDFKMPKNVQERVGPEKAVQIAKMMMTFFQFYGKWLMDRGLNRSSIASEVKVLAKTADALLEGSDPNVINSYSFELVCRRLYGFGRAFELVFSEADWRPPKGEGAKRWKSKIQWGMLEVFDLQALEGESNGIMRVDQEAHSVAEESRKFALYQSSLATVQQSSDSNAVPKTIVAIDGDGN